MSAPNMYDLDSASDRTNVCIFFVLVHPPKGEDVVYTKIMDKIVDGFKPYVYTTNAIDTSSPEVQEIMQTNFPQYLKRWNGQIPINLRLVKVTDARFNNEHDSYYLIAETHGSWEQDLEKILNKKDIIERLSKHFIGKPVISKKYNMQTHLSDYDRELAGLAKYECPQNDYFAHDCSIRVYEHVSIIRYIHGSYGEISNKGKRKNVKRAIRKLFEPLRRKDGLSPLYHITELGPDMKAEGYPIRSYLMAIEDLDNDTKEALNILNAKSTLYETISEEKRNAMLNEAAEEIKQ